MGDRIATIAPIAALAGALGLCCGLPILLSLGIVGAIAGVSLQSWALIGFGLVLATLGWARMVQGGRHEKSRKQPGAAGPMSAATAQTADNTTDTSVMRENP